MHLRIKFIQYKILGSGFFQRSLGRIVQMWKQLSVHLWRNGQMKIGGLLTESCLVLKRKDVWHLLLYR